VQCFDVALWFGSFSAIRTHSGRPSFVFTACAMYESTNIAVLGSIACETPTIQCPALPDWHVRSRVAEEGNIGRVQCNQSCAYVVSNQSLFWFAMHRI
jgi:hypothetical protein